MTPSQVALLEVAKKNEAGRKASETLIARAAAEARDERKEERNERKEASQQRKEIQTAMFQSLELMEQGRQTDMATLAQVLTPKKNPASQAAVEGGTTSFFGALISKAKDYVTPSKTKGININTALYDLPEESGDEEESDDESDSKPAARPTLAHDEEELDEDKDKNDQAEDDDGEEDDDVVDAGAGNVVNLWADKSIAQLKADLTQTRIKTLPKRELADAFYACFDKGLIAYSGLPVTILQEFCKGFGQRTLVVASVT
jgi:hypothetical protein